MMLNNQPIYCKRCSSFLGSCACGDKCTPSDRITAREIDSLVSEKVMGFVWDESRCRVCGWPLGTEGGIGCWKSNCSMRPMPFPHADSDPNYSTDIVAAFRVVERMKADPFGIGPHFELHWGPEDADKNDWEWVAVFGANLVKGNMFVEASGETAPLAICVAALRAADLRAKPSPANTAKKSISFDGTHTVAHVDVEPSLVSRFATASVDLWVIPPDS